MSRHAHQKPTIDSLAPEKRCYACNSLDVPKRVKIDGFTQALCVDDYARFRRGETLTEYEPPTATEPAPESILLLIPAPVVEAPADVTVPTPEPVDAFFPLRPDADAHPALCRRLGCDRPPALRGVCTPCHSYLYRAKALNRYALPSKSFHDGEGRARTAALKERIMSLVAKNPGISIDKLLTELGITRKKCLKMIALLRVEKQITTPKCNKSLPEYMMLHVRKP